MEVTGNFAFFLYLVIFLNFCIKKKSLTWLKKELNQPPAKWVKSHQTGASVSPMQTSETGVKAANLEVKDSGLWVWVPTVRQMGDGPSQPPLPSDGPEISFKVHNTGDSVSSLPNPSTKQHRAWPTAALLGQPPAPSFQKGSYLSLSFQSTHRPLQKLILPTPAAAGWFSAICLGTDKA